MILEEKNIYGWPGYICQSGDMIVGFVPQLGGRIMSLQFCGEELFFIQKEHMGETFELSQLAVNKKNFGFRVWGGDKTWIAPEELWIDKIPPLDLDAGRYSFSVDDINHSITMVSPVCRETGIQITRQVKVLQGHRLILNETITNNNKVSIQRGIWNVAQVLRPFDIYLPCSRENVRLYDSEAYQNCPVDQYVRPEGDWTVIPCRDQEHFKFGAVLRDGKILAVRRTPDQILVFIKSFPIDSKASYAHFSQVEVYNSPLYPYCEIEIHSPVVNVSPGQSVSQSQQWGIQSFPPGISLEDILKSISFSQF